MAVIVAFGDSNTWGYDPSSATRFKPDVRWTGVLRRELAPTIASSRKASTAAPRFSTIRSSRIGAAPTICRRA